MSTLRITNLQREIAYQQTVLKVLTADGTASPNWSWSALRRS